MTKLRKGGLYANEQWQDSKTTNESADSDLLRDTDDKEAPTRNQQLSDKRPQTDWTAVSVNTASDCDIINIVITKI